ncbi:triose-phosphate isomerase [Candidatus Microgenomates bacterium]|nr:MAG: triose-phosphate isomerase [Candidatus Microgenomates bacterium]
MKKIFIVANWKSNKDSIQVGDWIEGIKNYESGIKNTNKEVIICPSFVHLYLLKSLNNEPIIKIGAQNISPFDKGAYTGEVNGEQIKELADYVIIGHSERRKNFNETDDLINQKLKMAVKYQIVPILCISDLFQIQNSKFKIQNYNSKLKNENKELIIAYEPLFAIGSGQADTPENAEKVATEIKKELNGAPVLYGGSVTSENAKSFTQMPDIDGVLVGGASLDPLEFRKIIELT